jgi:hypothetical protein
MFTAGTLLFSGRCVRGNLSPSGSSRPPPCPDCNAERVELGVRMQLLRDVASGGPHLRAAGAHRRHHPHRSVARAGVVAAAQRAILSSANANNSAPLHAAGLG